MDRNERGPSRQWAMSVGPWGKRYNKKIETDQRQTQWQ